MKNPADKAKEKSSTNPNRIDQALDAAKLAADGLHDPTPMAGMIVGLIGTMVQVAITVRANKEQVKRLSTRVQAVKPMLERVQKSQCRHQFIVALEEFKNCVEACIVQAKKFQSDGFFTRIINHGTDRDNFESLNTRLNQSISQLDLGLSVEQTLLIEEHRQDEAKDKQDIMAKMDEILSLQEKNLKKTQEARNAQKHRFQELKDANELLQLNIESLPEEIAEKLELNDKERQAFLEQQFQLLHARFNDIKPYKAKNKPPIPRYLSIPFHTLEFEELLKEGSFGKVYLAQWHKTPVAAKRITGRLSDADYHEFIREIKIMAKLRHPNITQLYGACLEPEPVMVMEYMGQGSLESVISKQPLTLPALKQIALDIAKGLYYLHQQDVLHRDLKTGNILIDEQGRAKLADFGLSKTHDNKVDTIVKRTEAIEWMAPEVLEGQCVHSQASDIYSLGTVLWSMMTGQYPYADIELSKSQLGDSKDSSNELRKNAKLQMEILKCIKDGKKPAISNDCPEPLTKIIQSCWQAPEDRPQLSDIIEQLESMELQTQPRLSPRSLCAQAEAHKERKEYTPAFEAYLKSAQGGYMRGQTDLGMMYLQGRGTEQNKPLAYQWFNQAANQGHGRAMFNMGLMLEHGDGVNQNPHQAIHWYDKATEKGNPGAKQRADSLRAKMS